MRHRSQIALRGQTVQKRLADDARTHWAKLARQKHPQLGGYAQTAIPKLVAGNVSAEHIGSMVLRQQANVWLHNAKKLAEQAGIGSAHFSAQWCKTAQIYRALDYTRRDSAPALQETQRPAQEKPTFSDKLHTLQVSYRRPGSDERPDFWARKHRWIPAIIRRNHANLDIQAEALQELFGHCHQLNYWIHAVADRIMHYETFYLSRAHPRDMSQDHFCFRLLTQVQDIVSLFRCLGGPRAVVPTMTKGEITRSEINAVHAIDRHPLGVPLEEKPVHGSHDELSLTFPLHELNHLGLALSIPYAAREADVLLYDLAEEIGLVADDDQDTCLALNHASKLCHNNFAPILDFTRASTHRDAANHVIARACKVAIQLWRDLPEQGNQRQQSLYKGYADRFLTGAMLVLNHRDPFTEATWTQLDGARETLRQAQHAAGQDNLDQLVTIYRAAANA
jgi:hypothetical protein